MRRSTPVPSLNDGHESDLVTEAHHRVMNSLQLATSILRQQADGCAEDSKAKAAIIACCARLQAIAAVHRQLCLVASHDKIDMRAYLKDLSSELLKAAGGEGAAIEVQAVPLLLEPAMARACGILVTELVLNAFRHAYAPGEKMRVMVGLVPSFLGMHSLAVVDHGHGLPGGAKHLPRTGLGMTIVESMAQQIGAIPTIMSGSSGTCFVFDFPLRPLPQTDGVEGGP